MAYEKLITPNDEKTRRIIIKEGGFYSDVLKTWCISKSLTTNPSTQRKNIKSFLAKTGEIKINSLEAYIALLGEDLACDFDIDKNVTGTHISGKTAILDWVLKPKDKAGWKNPNVVLGIDFMLNSEMPTTENHTEWAKERILDAYTKWDGYGNLPVFLGPNNEQFFDSIDRNIQDLLYAYMIGYCSIKRGFQMFRSKRTVWCQRFGVQADGKSSPLIPKFGSR